MITIHHLYVAHMWPFSGHSTPILLTRKCSGKETRGSHLGQRWGTFQWHLHEAGQSQWELVVETVTSVEGRAKWILGDVQSGRWCTRTAATHRFTFSLYWLQIYHQVSCQRLASHNFCKRVCGTSYSPCCHSWSPKHDSHYLSSLPLILNFSHHGQYLSWPKVVCLEWSRPASSRFDLLCLHQGFPGGSDGKESAWIQETRFRSLGGEVPLEKGMANHSSILAWIIPCTEKPGGLQSIGSQRIRHNWATNSFTSLSVVLRA